MQSNIGLITAPLEKSGLIPLSNFYAIISQFSNPYVITGNSARMLFNRSEEMLNNKVIFIDYPIEPNRLLRAIRYVFGQLKYSQQVSRLNDCVDVWIFFTGGNRMFLPMLMARFHKKKIILCMPGSIVESAKHTKEILLVPIKILSNLTLNLANSIILYSPSLVSEWKLEKYRRKVQIAHRHFLDFNSFRIIIPLTNRPPLIGYIGRLSGEKGVQNFVQALPDILNSHHNIQVLIGGDGQLKNAIEASLKEKGFEKKVNVPGWIPHKDLPAYLNHLRLLILPSYTEGLPNIMLEAMACGTPVLVTPVGAIPDIVVDGVTGFIMKNNSPECIVENVNRALNSPKLCQIAENGKRFVEANFTFERIVSRWREIVKVN